MTRPARITFVIISVSDRVEDLNRLLDSIVVDARWREFDVCVMFQDPDGVADQIRHRSRITRLYVEPEAR